MASGIHSTISSLQTKLFLRWCPKWYEAFSDPKGGFYERLGKGFKPVATGQRRLVTQCRQLSIYSNASLNSNRAIYKNLKQQFEHILTYYNDPETGLWHFALEDSGAVADRSCDLYALSFVIFACSHYFRATGDERATKAAKQVLTLIDQKFRLPENPGLAEAIDVRYRPLPQMRRQNPHMHLLEACLFARETWDDPAYEAMADEMVGLFDTYFFDKDKTVLAEFYSDALHPHFEKGGNLEPGHYFEWVWLLKKHAALKGDEALHDKTCLDLLEWANTNGWDKLYGGIFDTVAPNGHVIADTKRIWPFCEALKANALILTLTEDRQAIKDRVAEMVRVFNDKYMQERGFWTEWLDRKLVPAADYMPGTTPYHVYFGITETMSILDKRGAGKSLGSKVETSLYGWRRLLSKAVRGLRRAFGG